MIRLKILVDLSVNKKEVKKLMKKRKDSERRTKEKEAAAPETDPKDEHDGN